MISLEVDGQTIQIVDGKLHANLDELGNEVTDLSGRVTAVESEVAKKQDKFATASPLDIKNVASVSLRDVTISGDNLLFGNNNLLTGQVGNSISTSSTFAQSIQTGIIIPYKFGQVLQFHCGGDTYVQGSDRKHGSPCVALFGHFNGAGDFVTALAINGFASYVSSDVRGNMGGALKAGAVSMLPNTTYQTTSGETSVERGENTINMGTDYSTYIQLMVNEAGNLMQGIYGHYGANSNNDAWGAMARTDVIQDRSLDSGQKVADIIAAIDTAVIIKGSDFGTIKKANFGLYDYSERLPWTQAGYDTFIANKGANLIDLDNPSIKPQLQLNIGDGLSVVGGKLTAAGGGGSAPANMVTTDTEQTITGAKSFKNTITAYRPFSFDCREGNARFDVIFNQKNTGTTTTAPLMNFNLDKFSDTIEFGVTNSNLKLIGNVKDGSGNKFLTSGNVTAGDNVAITKTADGIQISTSDRLEGQLANKVNLDAQNLSAEGKSLISGLSTPSNKYINLTLGASGSTYTAPANGWYVCFKGALRTTGYLYMKNNANGLVMETRSTVKGSAVSAYVPVQKGQSILVNYDAVGTDNVFRFIYAEGSK